MCSNANLCSTDINGAHDADNNDCATAYLLADDSAERLKPMHGDCANVELLSVHRRSTSSTDSSSSTDHIKRGNGTRRNRGHSLNWRYTINRRSFKRCLFFVLIIFVVSLIFLLQSYLSIYDVALNRDYYETDVDGWERNRTRAIPVYIQPNVNTTLIEPSTLCKTSAPILLLIVVCTAANHFDQRQTIRETWGNATEFNYSKFSSIHADSEGEYLGIDLPAWRAHNVQRMQEQVTNDTTNGFHIYDSSHTPSIDKDVDFETDFLVRTVFLVGRTLNNETQAQLINESRLYDDLIQENFMDTYNNLTIKSLMMLKWVNRNCADKVKFLMKSDDDTFVNVPNLIHHLLGGTVPVYRATQREFSRRAAQTLSSANRLKDYDNLLIGCMYRNVKPIHDVYNKWFVPQYMFDGETFPDYLAGIGYVMSIDTAMRLYNVSMQTPLLYLEDVYLTGLCAERARIRPKQCHLFKYTAYSNLCEVRGMITLHHIDSDGLKSAYDFVNNLTHKCPRPGKHRVLFDDESILQR